MIAHHGPSRSLGRDYVSVPRVDIEYPISVAVDVMTERVVAMFMLGTPFQGSYSMPTEIARQLSGDLLDACSEVGEERPLSVYRPAHVGPRHPVGRDGGHALCLPRFDGEGRHHPFGCAECQDHVLTVLGWHHVPACN